MPFPQASYYVYVIKVQVNSIDVSGAQFRLKNTTKDVDVLKTSNETDSNIIINLAECGDWDLNDTIELVTSLDSRISTLAHQVVSEDNSAHDFGTVSLLSVGAGVMVMMV